MNVYGEMVEESEMVKLR